jgi:hypothetical protein
MGLPKERRNFPGINIKDIKGLTVPFVFNNGMTYNGTNDFNYNTKTHPEGVFIIPLTAGTIQVQLFDQDDDEAYTISAAEITTYLGVSLPYRVKKVISGVLTTVTSMQIVW